MPNYIFIENEIVVRTHSSDTPFNPLPENGIQVTSIGGHILGQKYLGLDDEGNAITEPLPLPDPQTVTEFWWIDVGPFYDRFGADGIAIAASDNGACKAVQTLTGVRKYIDLKDPKVALMIDMLIGTQQPTALPYVPGSGPMTPEKKNAILNTPTTEYERHIKGLFPQLQG